MKKKLGHICIIESVKLHVIIYFHVHVPHDSWDYPQGQGLYVFTFASIINVYHNTRHTELGKVDGNELNNYFYSPSYSAIQLESAGFNYHNILRVMLLQGIWN